jgi:hypothetical protein
MFFIGVSFLSPSSLLNIAFVYELKNRPAGGGGPNHITLNYIGDEVIPRDLWV